MDETTHTHTAVDKTVAHWIKAEFGRQYFVTGITVVNRIDALDSRQQKRNDNADIIAILDGLETTVGNIGELWVRRSYGIMRKADELKLYYNATVAAQIDGCMNIKEIWVYGWVE